MKRLLFWVLVAATMAIYAVMVAWSLPMISTAAGDLMPFDMRPYGYTFKEARAFLVALSPEGREFYQDVQHRLDILYPLLITATLFFALVALLPYRWGRRRWLAVSPIVLVAVADWAENAAVSTLLSAGPEGITPQMVAEASRWSVSKAAVSTIAFMALLVMLGWHGWLVVKRRRAARV